MWLAAIAARAYEGRCVRSMVLYMATRAQSMDAMRQYVDRMHVAIEGRQHHDQRRAILQDLLRDGFDLTVDEVELERNVKVARTRGRIDLLYRTLAWEVKRDLDRERTDLERELLLYLREIGERALGIATDGFRFEVYNLDSGRNELVKLDELDMARDDVSLGQAVDWLDSYLFAIDNVIPTTEAVLSRFGLTSSVYRAAQSELAALWTLMQDESTATTKRREWEKLLEIVYGRQVSSDELWFRHTYLAMVARIFAYLAIVRHMPPQGDDIGIITGALFEPLGLENLVESDFFTWSADERVSAHASVLLRGIARSLDVFSVGQVDEDLLKELYENMVDPAERKLLGEFYTPDWLADLTLEEAGFSAITKVLDPACGSGTFIFAAIRRLRREGLDGRRLVEAAVNNIVGLDIHPLAVTVSRANFVLALRDDLGKATESLQIPIYMADTIAAPKAVFGRPIQVPAPVQGLEGDLRPWFELPTEHEPEQTATLEQLVHLLSELSDPSLDEAAALTGLAVRLREQHAEQNVDMWEANLRLMRALRLNDRDTIWGFVLANSAKPQSIAVDGVDIIAGNPPWLTLMEMTSASYKDHLKGLAKEFGLVPARGSRMGNVSHIDTATVFAVYCADHFLPKDRGRAAFVLPRSVMAGAAQHVNFREGRATINYAPVKAFDLDAVEPLFRIPASVMIFDKVVRSEKPAVPWAWPTFTIQGRLPRKNASRQEADESLTFDSVQAPTVTSRPSRYLPKARQGVDMRPRVFWLVEPNPDATVVDRRRPYVRSDSDAVRASTKNWKGIQLNGRVEGKYLFGTSLDVDPFRLGRLRLVALPAESDGNGGLRVMDENDIVSRGDSQMGSWLNKAQTVYEKVLRANDREPNGSVIDYLNTQHKIADQRPNTPTVLWGKGGTHVRAAVVPTGIKEVARLPVQGYVVDLNHYYVTCETLDEAHYLASVLNSKPVNDVVSLFQTRGQYGNRDIHRRPFEHVPIPLFDPSNELHTKLAQLSRELHQSASDIQLSARSYDTYVANLGTKMDEVNEAVRSLLAL